MARQLLGVAVVLVPGDPQLPGLPRGAKAHAVGLGQAVGASGMSGDLRRGWGLRGVRSDARGAAQELDAGEDGGSADQLSTRQTGGTRVWRLHDDPPPPPARFSIAAGAGLGCGRATEEVPSGGLAARGWTGVGTRAAFLPATRATTPASTSMSPTSVVPPAIGGVGSDSDSAARDRSRRDDDHDVAEADRHAGEGEPAVRSALGPDQVANGDQRAFDGAPRLSTSRPTTVVWLPGGGAGRKARSSKIPRPE